MRDLSGIPGSEGDATTIRHDALSLAFEALVRRLFANGALRPDDLPAMRATASAFPAALEGSATSGLQVGGARLSEAVTALFDRLDRSDWRPVSSDDIWRTARMLVAQRGLPGATASAWDRVRELTADCDRLGVDVWIRILDALDEIGRYDEP